MIPKKILLTLKSRIQVMMKLEKLMKWTVFPSSSSRRGSEDHRTHGETSFIEGIDEHTRLIRRENKRDEAWDRIKRKFPNINPANSFVYRNFG